MLLGSCRCHFFLNINPSVFILLSFQSALVFVWIIKAQFFQPTLYTFIVLDFLGLSSPTFGLGNLNQVLTIIIIIMCKNVRFQKGYVVQYYKDNQYIYFVSKKKYWMVGWILDSSIYKHSYVKEQPYLL